MTDHYLTDQNRPGPAAKPSAKPARRWPWVLLVLLILALGYGGFKALHKFKPQPVVKPLVRQAPAVNAVQPDIRQGSIPVRGNGLVQARTRVTLAAELSARIIGISPNLVAGGQFEKDEVLIELDPAPFRSALAQARADRQSARAAWSLAQQSVKRTQNLIEQGFLSRQTLDERIATRDQAAASLQRAQAAYERRQIDMSRTQIKAPFSGRVLSSAVNSGDTVQPGRQLASIFDAGELEVTVSLTSDKMALIDAWNARQQTADALVWIEHGGARYRWPGRLNRVEAAIDSQTRTFNLVVDVLEPQRPGTAASDNVPPGPPLVVGMYAQVEITGRNQGRYALIPQRALRPDNTVWIADQDNKIRLVKVRLITELNDQIAVTAKQLSSKSRVIISDLRVVTPGMPVRVVLPTSSAGDASSLQAPQGTAKAGQS